MTDVQLNGYNVLQHSVPFPSSKRTCIHLARLLSFTESQSRCLISPLEHLLHPGDGNIFICASIENPSLLEVYFYVLFHALHDPPVQVLSHNYPKRLALPK